MFVSTIQQSVSSQGSEYDAKVARVAVLYEDMRFECTAFSGAEHVAKPDPEIYLRALQRLGVEPARAAYIGDGDDDELGGAERIGLHPARASWFVRNPSLSGMWPELTNSEDVLNFIAAG